MTDIARELIPLTDEELEDLFDERAQIGLGVEDLSFGPIEEIANFRAARKGWAKPGRIDRDDDKAFIVLEAAAVKGQSRRTVALIPVTAEFCAIYGMDR